MPACRILRLGPLGKAPEAAFRRRADDGQRAALDVRKAQLIHIRYVELPAHAADISDGVRAGIPKFRGIRHCTDARAVQHDQDHSFFHDSHLMLSLPFLAAGSQSGRKSGAQQCGLKRPLPCRKRREQKGKAQPRRKVSFRILPARFRRPPLQRKASKRKLYGKQGE
ncbi:unknown [Clostridium sp. CAG:1024]|nr:unknown [Clostridium sp. CAG:1024]